MFFSNFFIVFVVKIYFPKVVYTLDHTFFQKKKGFGGKYCIKVELEFAALFIYRKENWRSRQKIPKAKERTN